MSEPTAFMREALALARRGLGRTWPNPAVGSVVVVDGEVVGRGSHPRAGESHAEVLALREAGARARGATVYVSLEPCCHQGRTPPCTEALIEAGVARVVYASRDPNPRVDGGGEARLKEAGVEVEGGLLEDEAGEILSGFACLQREGRPEILVKAAVTLDGQLAPASGRSQWITSAEARREVHRLRDECDAILVGSGTVLADDPSLTVRDPAPADGRQPLRILLDGRGRIPPGARCLGEGALVLTGDVADAGWCAEIEATGAEVMRLAHDQWGLDLHPAFRLLGERGLTRVMVEGGGTILGALLAARLADRAAFFYGPILVGAGGHGLTGGFRVEELAGGVRLEDTDMRRLGPDWLVQGRLVHPGEG